MFRTRKTLAMRLTTALCSGVVAYVSTTGLAFAQSSGPVGAPPIRSNLDENGVDVVTGTYNIEQTDVSVGSKDGGLAFVRSSRGSGWLNPYFGTIKVVGAQRIVSIGGQSTTFTLTGSVYVSDQGTGATLTYNSTTLIYTYTTSDGTVATFEPLTNTKLQYGVYAATLTKMKFPSGFEMNMRYRFQNHCVRVGSLCDGGAPKRVARLQSVNSNTGYQLKFKYAYNPSDSPPFDVELINAWYQLTEVTGLNNAVEYCSPDASLCTFVNTWPKAQYSVDGLQVTDPLNRVTTYTKTSGRITGIRRPSSATTNITLGYDAQGRVATYSDGAGSWSYGYVDAGNVRTTTVTNPNAQNRVIVSDMTQLRPTSVADELGRTTGYQYDATGRVTRMIAPEGNYTDYSYDARGNVILTTSVAKSGSGLANIVTSASYPASCSNPVTCNKPASTTDPRGNVTDYVYDSTHGGTTSVTAPPPTSGAVRPQTRYSYTPLYAWYKNSGGTVVQALTPVYKQTTSSSCQTLASCTGGADETKTTVAYGTSGVANNLSPTVISSGSGDGVLTATQAMTYDNVSNLVTSDGPLSGSADTTRILYDAARQPVGVIGPDPDGAGARLNRAVRYTYNLDGQVTLTEAGTTAGQSDANWAAFAPLQSVASTYDANARKATDKMQAGGTTYALTQYSYDTLSRLDCSATRMNPAIYGSLPSSACTLGTAGSFGPDRVTKTTYDAASQVTKTETGLGTTEVTSVSATYSLNGKQATVADGLGNLTTYEYDAFDRLLKTRYPIAGSGTVSSTTDYEGLSYDANSNVTQRRLRDGQTTAYTYDNLSRVTLKDVANTVYYENDIQYSYDLLGRVTLASNGVGRNATLGYDALGRLTSETSFLGTKTMQYDLAGRMTRLTHPDSMYFDYDYRVTGEVSAIRENGATSGVGVLATYAYDDLGRRTTLYRGNSTQTDYAYDPVSRLATLTNNLGATAHDVTTTFGYSPASQIASSTRDNDAYAWNGHYNVDRPYGVNGLNQLTTAGSVALGYDGRGNLTTSGTSSYTYTSENRLATQSSVVSLAYESLGRLSQTAPTSGTATDFDYTGSSMIAEKNASTGALLRRYVYGPGTDEPLVWYEGSGTTDRRWLYTDERGSVTAIANASGNAIALNSYDEYGIPAAANIGRFQYTGQAWLPELGMYYYKARIYSPTLGRFMQTDPIGYADGINWYNYVGSDPVNGTDPSGLAVDDPIVVTAQNSSFGGVRNFSGSGSRNYTGPSVTYGPDIVVTAQRYKPSIKNLGEIAPWKGGAISQTGDDGAELIVTGTRNRLEIAQADLSVPPTDFLRWWYTNVRDAAGFQADRTKTYLKDCYRNRGNVNAGTVARDAARGGLQGAVKGAVQGAVLGEGVGPEGAVVTGALNGARGAATGTVTGAGRSVISQACPG